MRLKFDSGCEGTATRRSIWAVSLQRKNWLFIHGCRIIWHWEVLVNAMARVWASRIWVMCQFLHSLYYIYPKQLLYTSDFLQTMEPRHLCSSKSALMWTVACKGGIRRPTALQLLAWASIMLYCMYLRSIFSTKRLMEIPRSGLKIRVECIGFQPQQDSVGAADRFPQTLHTKHPWVVSEFTATLKY